MGREINQREPDPDRRTVYFHLLQLDGTSPCLTKDGQQPEISIDKSPFSPTGISPLQHIGYGRYAAVLEQDILIAGTHIETRFGAVDCIEMPGDAIDVIAYDKADENLAIPKLDEIIDKINNIDTIIIQTGVK